MRITNIDTLSSYLDRLITERIKNITNHLNDNKKDHSGRRGLVLLVAKRRKLLNYLHKNNASSYKNILEQLKIRK